MIQILSEGQGRKLRFLSTVINECPWLRKTGSDSRFPDPLGGTAAAAAISWWTATSRTSVDHDDLTRNDLWLYKLMNSQNYAFLRFGEEDKTHQFPLNLAVCREKSEGHFRHLSQLRPGSHCALEPLISKSCFRVNVNTGQCHAASWKSPSNLVLEICSEGRVSKWVHPLTKVFTNQNASSALCLKCWTFSQFGMFCGKNSMADVR